MRKMKKTLLMLVPMFVAIAAVPAGYEHWTAEQFATHEQTLYHPCPEIGGRSPVAAIGAH